MLNLKDAYARIERAKELHRELGGAWHQWNEADGIQLICERDPEHARYVWGVVMHSEPERNLALIAGEIFNNLRSALDYIAFQIFVAGGGDRTTKQAKSVAFPIVTEEERWGNAVKANVPYAWDEAVLKLQWCQPFVQIGPQSTALPALRGVGATDKHHNLVLYAAPVTMVEAIAPDLSDGLSMIAMMVVPGPTLAVNEPGIVAEVCVHEGNSDSVGGRVLVPWSSGIELKQPGSPRVQFGFRASDGSEVTIDAIDGLIFYVEEMVKRFSTITTPVLSPSREDRKHHSPDSLRGIAR